MAFSKIIADFSELPLSDDFMFGEIMRRPELCKQFLEALLGKKIAKIKYITKQQDISDSYTSHGIRIDVYLKDDLGTVYCIEMQTTGGILVLAKRIRYYQGAIDLHNLSKSERYKKLPETFIIMICTMDLIGRGLAVYKRKVTFEGCEDYSYVDGTHVYLLNSDYTTANADDKVLEFLHCVGTNETNAEKYNSQFMKDVCHAIVEVRSDPGKRDEYMTLQTRLMDAKEEGLEEGLERGREEGLERGREEGIQALVQTLQNLSVARDTVIQQLEGQFGLPADVAATKVAQYWT